MVRAHKIRLHPTPEQAVYFAKAAGTSRFVWNWALAEWNRQHEAGEKPTALKLKKQFNEIRREQFPWTWEVTKNASDQPFLDLGHAFTAFFEGRARRPKFKSKKRSKPSFYLANDQFELGDHRIWVPKLGWVNMAEKLRFAGKVTGARITKTAEWWFVSIQVELPDAIPVKRSAAVGIDVGLTRLATLSTGEGVENQAFLKTALKKLRRANKRLHRRKPGSNNREKARRQVARLHYRIACMREDALHKVTTRLADSYGIVGVEALNLKGLLKNRRLARSFSDASLGTLRRLLETKVAARGGQVIKVGRFFPSSKTCHCCGWKWEDMTLKDRVFVCQNPRCPYYQFPQDRDHNAGQNVLREALRLIGLIDQVSPVLARTKTQTWLWTRGKTKKAPALRLLRMKQQQRNSVWMYACIRLHRKIGAEDCWYRFQGQYQTDEEEVDGLVSSSTNTRTFFLLSFIPSWVIS